MQALAASLPLFFFFTSLLIFACLIFSQVKTPKPIGLRCSLEISIIFLAHSLAINSKWYVSPRIIQPSAIKPLYFLIFFEIKKGISKQPGANRIS